MQLRDGIRNFGTVSIGNHWITALLIVAVFAVAILMDELPRGRTGKLQDFISEVDERIR